MTYSLSGDNKATYFFLHSLSNSVVKISRTGTVLSGYRIGDLILYHEIRCILAGPEPESPATGYPAQP